ncbi:MAG: hypothetical protein LQ338_000134 [Usnochroma carphineum]|nr:MAG: hypothetical protein LQ338_000134 [Usnochroma carphineum]
MQTWSRHEKEDHEDISFPCMPNGAIGFTKYGRECAFCGQEPTEEHLRSHNIEQCTQLKHVFKRSYELKQHLEAHGVAKESKLSKMLVTMWQRKPDKQAWACGFCKGLFSSLPEFHKHIATQHYERGETREWDHTKVILGLLSQPRIAALWHRLLVTRFKVQSLSCKWKKSRTRELQLRLELGQEPGDVLALAALDCAAYDHGLLHEVYRRSDTWTSTSDTSTTFGALGPPVPPKPLASRPSSQEQSSSKTRNTDEKRATEISPSDRFKTPSPQLFDSSLHGTDIHAEYPTFSSEDILHDLNRDNLADLGDPIDIDMEWQTDYSSQLHFPLEETQDFQDTWIGARSPELHDIFSCLAASWPPASIGSLLTPQAPDAELVAILSEIDPRKIQAIITKLVSFGTRHTLSNQTDPNRGIGAARDWIEQQMRSFAAASNGQMEVTVPSYIQGVGERILFPVRISDVVATLRGSVDPGRYHVVSGHYDTRCSDPNDYTCDAPGADDDGSGVAVIMELARIMATRRPAATIVFAAVAGEEQNLYGSRFLAQTYRNTSVNVQSMFTNDIVGSSTADNGTKDPYTLRIFAQGSPTTESPARSSIRAVIGGENDSPARELARFVVGVAENNYTQMNIPVIYRLDRFLRGGDHEPFLEAGYTACRFTEPNENFAHQHQNVRVENGRQYGDLIEFVDFDYVARVAKVNAAALWSLANAPMSPQNVTVNATLLSNESQFKWLTNNDTLTVGYEALWRPTDAPLWTHVVPLGDVNAATVPLSKDNVIFGIRAVGQNGYASPATFPFPG